MTVTRAEFDMAMKLLRAMDRPHEDIDYLWQVCRCYNGLPFLGKYAERGIEIARKALANDVHGWSDPDATIDLRTSERTR